MLNRIDVVIAIARAIHNNGLRADVAELADALDLGSSFERSEGSSPFVRTTSNLDNLFTTSIWQIATSAPRLE